MFICHTVYSKCRWTRKKNIYIYLLFYLYICIISTNVTETFTLQYNLYIIEKTSVHCIEYHELKTVFIGHLNIIYLNDIA